MMGDLRPYHSVVFTFEEDVRGNRGSVGEQRQATSFAWEGASIDDRDAISRAKASFSVCLQALSTLYDRPLSFDEFAHDVDSRAVQSSYAPVFQFGQGFWGAIAKRGAKPAHLRPRDEVKDVIRTGIAYAIGQACRETSLHGIESIQLRCNGSDVGVHRMDLVCVSIPSMDGTREPRWLEATPLVEALYCALTANAICANTDSVGDVVELPSSATLRAAYLQSTMEAVRENEGAVRRFLAKMGVDHKAIPR